MISAYDLGVISAQVKPLGVIWAQSEGRFGPHNTIMFDDLSRNFLMNPQSGLKIRPCRNLTVPANREKDVELRRLARYLDLISHLRDFAELDHRRWERYLEKRGEGGRDDGEGSAGGSAGSGASG